MASISTGNFTPSEYIDSASPDIKITTEAPATTYDSERNFRRVDGGFGGETFAVSNITQDGYIRLSGKYPQNYIDVPKYNLSDIIVIAEGFEEPRKELNFILSIKDGMDSIPILYASKNYYDGLISEYNNKKPFGVNASTHERSIVVIDIKPLKELTESMRVAELSINLNRTGTNGQIEVTRNLFTNSNYKSDSNGDLVASPSYDLNKLINYIIWVVDKPNTKGYDERLIPANVLGDWIEIEPYIPDEDEPSNVGGISTTLYEPVGRFGSYPDEEVIVGHELYIWNDEVYEWQTTIERDEYERVNGVNTTTGGGQQGTNSTQGRERTLYPPIGRAGTSVGETVSAGGMTYLWNGTEWIVL